MCNILIVLKDEEPDALVQYLETSRQEVEFVAEDTIRAYPRK